MYCHSVGIEHLSTGVEFECAGNLSFTRQSRSIFTAWSLQPFTVVWHTTHGVLRLQAQFSHIDMPCMPPTDDEVRQIADKANRGEL